MTTTNEQTEILSKSIGNDGLDTRSPFISHMKGMLGEMDLEGANMQEPKNAGLEDTCHLMVTGQIMLRQEKFPLEIRRGMTILAKDGTLAGKVAAVVLAKTGRPATHLLLSHLPDQADYRLVPAESVLEARQDTIVLNLSSRQVKALPRWRSDQPF